MSKSITKGTVFLIVSGLICKLLGAFFRLPLTRILGVRGIGVFQLVMSLYSFALILCSGGVTVTLSRIIAKARAKGDQERIDSVFKVALITSACLGLVLGLIFFVFSKQIAMLQGDVLSNKSYMAMIILLPLGGIIATLRGAIQGYENMLPTAVSQVIEQGIRFVFGLFLAGILVRFGIDFGVFGAFLGIVLGEIFSVIYLLMSKRKIGFKARGEKTKGFFSELIPLLLGAVVFPLVNAVDSLVIVGRLNLAGLTQTQAITLYGLQTGIVGAVLNLPLILSTSIAVAILPTMSFQKNQTDVYNGVNKALKILWIILLPTVLGIMAVCKPLYKVLYAGIDETSLEVAVNLTRLGGISTIITALMQFFVAIVQVRGKLYYLMGIQILGGALKILLVIILCAFPQINVYGLILGNIAMSSVVCVGCLFVVRPSVSLHYFDLATPLFSSILMFFIVNAVVNYLQLSSVITLVVSIVTGCFIYGVLTLPCVFGLLKEIYLSKFRKRA